VVDQKGEFVRGLQAGDFEVVEDGRRQVVSALRVVDVDTAAAGAAHPDDAGRSDAGRSGAPSHSFDNAGAASSRLYVLLLDDLHTNPRRSGRVRELARRFITRHLGPDDVAAVLTTGSLGGADQDFTSSPRLLLNAVDAFVGGAAAARAVALLDAGVFRLCPGVSKASPSDTAPELSTAAEEANAPPPIPSDDLVRRVHDAEASLSVMTQVATVLARIEGRRKALVYVGEGIDIDTVESVGAPSDRDPAAALSAMRAFVETAARGNVTVYTIDPRGLAGDDALVEAANPGAHPADPAAYRRVLAGGLRVSVERAREWATETGGLSIVATNDLEAGLERIVRESSRYYLLEYDSTSAARDGRFHRIEVRVKRPGASVRARRGYWEPDVRSAAVADDRSALDRGMALPVANDAVRLSLSVAPFRGEDGRTELVVGVVADGRDVEATRESGERLRAALEFRVAAIDRTGKVVADRRAVSGGTFTATRRAAFEARGLYRLDRLDLAPGSYRLRVGAATPGSVRAGVLQADVEVPDLTSAPLAASGLLLGSRLTRPASTAGVAERFKEWLPNGPTAARHFSTDDELSVFLELYGRTDVFPVEVAARLLDERGSVVLEQATTLAAAAVTVRPFVAHVPLADLAPGRYTVRVEISSSAEKLTIVREVTFQVDPAS
jgi:VWFA-related protein